MNSLVAKSISCHICTSKQLCVGSTDIGSLFGRAEMMDTRLLTVLLVLMSAVQAEVDSCPLWFVPGNGSLLCLQQAPQKYCQV